MYEPESDRAHGFPRIAGHAAQSADNGPGRKRFLIDTGDTFDGVDGGYPGAPPSWAASATGVICPIFGVIFASIGRWVPRRVAAVNRRTSSGLCPTSLPIPSCVICGQEKLHSMISAPAAWNIGQAVSTHRLSVP